MRRLLLAIVILLLSRPAAADPYADASRAEQELRFADALAGYDEAAHGSTDVAARAERRSAALRARSEGDFVPLATLERARRDPHPDLDAFVRTADTFPPGTVRVEAWVFAADAYGRNGHPEDAVPLWRKAARDPAADPIVARAAIRSAVNAHLANDEIDQAGVDLTWFPDPAAAAEVHRMARRHSLHIASIATVLGVLAAIALAIARSKRRVLASIRRAAPIALAYALYVALGGVALASGYAAGNGAPFLWFGIVLVPLLLAARAWAAAGGAPRVVRAAACAASVLAAAFLVLERTGRLDALGL